MADSDERNGARDRGFTRRWTAVVLAREERAREHIVALLRDDPEVEVVAVVDDCSNVDVVAEHTTDLLILSADMACRNGAAFLQDVADMGANFPEVIFIASDLTHALSAFEWGAADYVVQPFGAARLHDAVERVKTRLRQREVASLFTRLASLHSRDVDAFQSLSEQGLSTGPGLRKILVRSRGKTLFVDVADLCYIEAENYHTRAHTETSSYLLRHALSWFEAKLDPRKFVRVHRSYIVNVDRIVSIQPWSGGSYDLLLQGGGQVRLSAARKGELEGVIGQTI